MFWLNTDIEVCISFDTTGSMYPCIGQVRRRAAEAVTQLFKDIPGIRISVIAHGDYCDDRHPYITKTLDFTTNVNSLVEFINKVEPTCGGDADECYEKVLHDSQLLSWTPGHRKVLIMIGDALPHAKGYHYGAHTALWDWREEAKKLGDMGVSIYAVQALGWRGSEAFYEKIAELSHGFKLELDQFQHVVELINAISYHQSGPDNLKTYEQKLVDQNRMSRSLSNTFDKLLGRKKTENRYAGSVNLKACRPGRFQVLDVDHDVSIREFVNDNGLYFQTGRGFYEFMKTETIQGYKEIILEDRTTGDLFEGSYARELLGLGSTTARIRPTDLTKYRVFVQSTSYNRKLIGGTKFLYEVERR